MFDFLDGDLSIIDLKALKTTVAKLEAEMKTKLEDPSADDLEWLEQADARLEAGKAEIAKRDDKSARLDALKTKLEAEAVEVEETTEEVEVEETAEVVEEVATEEVVEENAEEEVTETQVIVTDIAEVELVTKSVDVNAVVGQEKLPEEVSGTGLYSIATGKPVASVDEFAQQAWEAFERSQYGHDGEVIKAFRLHYPESDVSFSPDNKYANFTALKSSEFEYQSDEGEALVASACCSPYDIDRRIPRYARVEDTLTFPRVNVPHGGLQYAYPAQACNLNVEYFEWLEGCDDPCLENNLDQPPKNDPKSCQTIECGEFRSVSVDAWGWCFEYSTGDARFNREQVQYWLAEAFVRFQRLASLRRLMYVLNDPIFEGEDAPVKTCAMGGGGALPDLMEALAVSAAKIRQDLCNTSLPLVALVPSELKSIAMVDRARRGDTGLTLDQVFSRLNIRPVYVADWPGQRIGKDACGFNPDTCIILHTVGHFREAWGGTLDWGFIRDTEAFECNKVKFAFEEWSKPFNAGPDCGICKINITDLCPNGAIGPRVDTCGGAYVGGPDTMVYDGSGCSHPDGECSGPMECPGAAIAAEQTKKELVEA